MKKVWIYKRKGSKGYYVAWYEQGKQKTKLLPNKHLAEHFQHLKYHQLNSDVFQSAINLPWADLKAEFLQRYDIRQVTKLGVPAVQPLRNYDIYGIHNASR